MAPIRTAIVGLSSSAATGWAKGAHIPYLLSARGKARYEIVALLNSSEDAARRAIKEHGLPATTKAYGDPAALAADPDVDLVVISTRVDTHHAAALPSVRAGKALYVEWPLAQDSAHARELADAARQATPTGAVPAGRPRTIVGLQGRLVPVMVKIGDLIREGRIGKVLSSELRAAGGTNDRDRLPAGLKYFTDSAIGGNIVTIGLGHLYDQIQHVLGDIQDPKDKVQLQRPDVKVFDPSTKQVVETVRSNVPDLVVQTGRIAGGRSATVAEDATLSLRFRRGQPFPGDPPLVWTINGEKGEIQLRAEGGTAVHASGYDKPVVIEVFDFASDSVQAVDWAWADWQEELPFAARSVAAVYEAFAAGDAEHLTSFDEALTRHEQLEGLLARSGFAPKSG